MVENMMGEQQQSDSGDRAVAKKADGNPEGKGLSEFLRDRNRSQPFGVVAKPRRQLLGEFFASMLVLSATFKFRPVVGTSNFLYWIDNEWSLSLIAPDEWSHARRAGFVARCVLQADMTWTITPSEHLSENNPLSDAVRQFYDAFVKMLDTDLTLEEILPYYVAKFPYYPRLFASALSRSLHTSLILGDQVAVSCRRWHELVSPTTNRISSPQRLGV